MDKQEIRHALTGPIASVRTPFHQDGSIDFGGLRNSLDFYIASGSKSLLLTYGDSLYSILTDAEIAEVTKVVAEHAAGRAMVVAADKQCGTPAAIEFAEYARGVGADLLMVLPPDWAGSGTPDSLAEHYAAVAEHIPVMLVTNYFLSRGESFGLQLIDLLLKCDGIVAVKDDTCDAFARKMALRVHEHWAVFAGGQKQNHLNIHPYGCDGYLSTFITFKPEVAHTYWSAIESNDMDSASDIVRRYDFPFFDYICALPGGFSAGAHGALEVFGIANRWRRKPYYSLNDEEMEKLSDFLKGLPSL